VSARNSRSKNSVPSSSRPEHRNTSNRSPIIRNPQSACGGAPTNLSVSQNHSGIVQYVSTFEDEVVAAGKLGRPLFFGETNSGMLFTLED